MIKSKRILLATIITSLMVGCGGGGSSTPTPTPTPAPTPAPTPVATADEITITGDLSPAVGESVALIATIMSQKTDISQINWVQTAGETLKLVAKNSAVLAFDIDVAGTYSFKVDITTIDGTQLSKEVSVTTQSGTNILNARRDHAVREGNKVSFKLSAPISATTGKVLSEKFTNVSWTHVSGPEITFDDKNTNPYTAIFKAPLVASDSVVTLQVSATHPDGRVVNDKVFLLVQDITDIPANSIYKTTIARVKPYNPDTSKPYGLKNCIYDNYFSAPCSLEQINLIGQDHQGATVDNIMDRVITSHPWMAENFKTFLTEQDPHGDFKKLLRSVSAIVISYDIRPSYYWVATGAIHLDPEDLWLTPEQRDVIDVAPDYRGAFGQELKYVMPWRYVKDNDYASSYYPKELRITRTIADLVPDLGSLLYHELAHANDTFPSSSLDSISGTSVYNAFQKRNGNTISDKLTATHPKSSPEMASLGQVNFHGADPTAAEIAYTPDQIADFFKNDSAPTEYAYSSEAEDVATLFDAAMMSARYGIERDEAVSTPRSADASIPSYVLSWGQRGRITDPAVQPRSKFVFDLIFPELDSDEIYSKLPAVRSLTSGVTWGAALTDGFVPASAGPQKARAAGQIERPVELDLIRRYK